MHEVRRLAPEVRPGFSYPERLNEYIASVRGSLQNDIVARPPLQARELRRAIEEFSERLEDFATRLGDHHRALFERREGRGFDYGEAEVQLVRAIDDGLRWARRVAAEPESGLRRWTRFRAAQGFREATRQLERYGDNRGPGLRDLHLVAPSARAKRHLATRVVLDHLWAGNSFMELGRGVDESAFLRPDKADAGVRFTGWSFENRERGAVYVNVINHDCAFFDAVLGSRL